MSDLAVTPANVLPSVNASIIRGIAGATLTAGMPCYLDPTTNTYKPAKANGASPIYDYEGIALVGSSLGQPVLICTQDPNFTPGCTVNAGDVLIVSGANAGGIAPVSDKASGYYITVLGIGIGSNQMNLLAPNTAANPEP